MENVTIENCDHCNAIVESLLALHALGAVLQVGSYMRCGRCDRHIKPLYDEAFNNPADSGPFAG